MTSHEPEGAVDKSFDAAERDARSILQENIDSFPSDIRGGDVVIDLVKNRPLYVRRKVADTAVDYFDTQDFDLTTYKAHPFLPVSPDDTIFECAFLPTTVEDIRTSAASKSYDYPTGRLIRVPVEYYFDSKTHRADRTVEAVLATIFASTRDEDRRAVVGAIATAFGGDTVTSAIERAGFDPDSYHDAPDSESETEADAPGTFDGSGGGE